MVFDNTARPQSSLHHPEPTRELGGSQVWFSFHFCLFTADRRSDCRAETGQSPSEQVNNLGQNRKSCGSTPARPSEHPDFQDQSFRKGTSCVVLRARRSFDRGFSREPIYASSRILQDGLAIDANLVQTRARPARHATASNLHLVLRAGHETSVSNSLRPTSLLWMHAGSCNAACRLARMLA